MLLNYNLRTDSIEKESAKHLFDFQIDERNFQNILFRSLDRLFPDDELIMVMQSRRWREEPDLMAIDKNGYLFIFELKAWESNQENILQVLRYGQLYGDADYDKLNGWYKHFNLSGMDLEEEFSNKFGYCLSKQEFNRKQVFIVMTNGIDYKTREAVKYWRTCNLDIRPWIYKIYEKTHGIMQAEISPFRVEDNPYEDISGSYYILNTNINNDKEDHINMIENGKCAAYFEPWKYKIQRLSKGDVVFLYQSGTGIVAYGNASGKLEKSNYHDDIEKKDEEYWMKLNNYHRIDPPISASRIKEITDVDYRFMSTMFGIDNENGKMVFQECELRKYTQN
jgi:hypothetical protein